MSPRVALVIVSSLQLLFCSGLILGWAGVLLLLNGEHTFRAACDDPDLTPAGTCDESDLMLNFIFTVASTSYGAAPVLFGPLIDKCGPRVVCVLSCALLSCGFLLIAISEYPSRNLFLVGFVIIATFGVGVQLTVFHVANLFPKNHVRPSPSHPRTPCVQESCPVVCVRVFVISLTTTLVPTGHRHEHAVGHVRCVIHDVSTASCAVGGNRRRSFACGVVLGLHCGWTAVHLRVLFPPEAHVCVG